ncbi:MAG: TraR/DksA family transcriptional regulator [Candidatus Latescibacteria bacterium]|jgi:DnaK suppressor protein|nr:TraR/DksA family transcriptional regulator [Candidatus Latescibacterota bacterium]
MDAQILAQFKVLLEEKHLSIAQDLGVLQSQSMKTTAAESSGDLTYSDHMGELGSSTMEREKAFMFASRDGVYLNQIEKALKRIEDGTFGLCRVCGNQVPVARLEAVPTTEICVPCKEGENSNARKSA